jgi:hypothetical protein
MAAVIAAKSSSKQMSTQLMSAFVIAPTASSSPAARFTIYVFAGKDSFRLLSGKPKIYVKTAAAQRTTG